MREPSNVHVQQTFRLNAPDVVAQVIAGEVIFIAFSTGAYFNARGSGAAILQAVQERVPLSSLPGQFAATEAWPPPAIEREVARFLEQLLAEGLLVADDAPPARDAPPLKAEPAPFEPPLLEKYTDLEDLLVLDPIHDVDSAGWPVAAKRS